MGALSPVASEADGELELLLPQFCEVSNTLEHDQKIIDDGNCERKTVTDFLSAKVDLAPDTQEPGDLMLLYFHRTVQLLSLLCNGRDSWIQASVRGLYPVPQLMAVISREEVSATWQALFIPLVVCTAVDVREHQFKRKVNNVLKFDSGPITVPSNGNIVEFLRDALAFPAEDAVRTELEEDGSPLFVLSGGETLDASVWNAFKQYLFRKLERILSTNELEIDEAFAWQSVDLTFSVVDAFEKLYALGLLRNGAVAHQVDLLELLKLREFKVEPVVSTQKESDKNKRKKLVFKRVIDLLTVVRHTEVAQQLQVVWKLFRSLALDTTDASDQVGDIDEVRQRMAKRLDKFKDTTGTENMWTLIVEAIGMNVDTQTSNDLSKTTERVLHIASTDDSRLKTAAFLWIAQAWHQQEGLQYHVDNAQMLRDRETVVASTKVKGQLKTLKADWRSFIGSVYDIEGGFGEHADHRAEVYTVFKQLVHQIREWIMYFSGTSGPAMFGQIFQLRSVMEYLLDMLRDLAIIERPALEDLKLFEQVDEFGGRALWCQFVRSCYELIDRYCSTGQHRCDSIRLMIDGVDAHILQKFFLNCIEYGAELSEPLALVFWRLYRNNPDACEALSIEDQPVLQALLRSSVAGTSVAREYRGAHLRPFKEILQHGRGRVVSVVADLIFEGSNETIFGEYNIRDHKRLIWEQYRSFNTGKLDFTHGGEVELSAQLLFLGQLLNLFSELAANGAQIAERLGSLQSLALSQHRSLQDPQTSREMMVRLISELWSPGVHKTSALQNFPFALLVPPVKYLVKAFPDRLDLLTQLLQHFAAVIEAASRQSQKYDKDCTERSEYKERDRRLSRGARQAPAIPGTLVIVLIGDKREFAWQQSDRVVVLLDLLGDIAAGEYLGVATYITKAVQPGASLFKRACARLLLSCIYRVVPQPFRCFLATFQMVIPTTHRTAKHECRATNPTMMAPKLLGEQNQG
eukprot:SAG11_NODE_479_length_9108_cov_3.699856_2_plen_973_part_00